MPDVSCSTCTFGAGALRLLSGGAAALQVGVSRSAVRKLSLEHRYQTTRFGPATAFGRMARGKYTVVGALLAAAIAGVGLYHVQADFRSQTVNTNEAASQSPAYQFGFAHAALAGCDFAPGAELDQLVAAVQANAHGILSDDVKTGFGDFQELQQAHGTADACRRAERYFGPRARLRPGVLMPR